MMQAIEKGGWRHEDGAHEENHVYQYGRLRNAALFMARMPGCLKAARCRRIFGAPARRAPFFCKSTSGEGRIP